MECFSFSAASRIYKLLKGPYRQLVSAEFSLQHDILESWLHFLSYVRNLCAHHASLWSRSFTISPQIPKVYRTTWPDSKRLYIACCVAHHMMKIIADGSHWSQRLEEQVKARSAGERSIMGFPDGWETSAFWKG